MNWTMPYPWRPRRDSVRRINMSSEPGNESFFCALRPIPRILSLRQPDYASQVQIPERRLRGWREEPFIATFALRENAFGMLERLLSVSDSMRAFDLLKRLGQHRIEPWALTGGLAIEMHVVLAGQTPQRRSLNDLDFFATHFADIPETLPRHFLFRHVHPAEVPGRTMMQFVDVEAKLRIDVFRATGASMRRAGQMDLPT